ncbi:MAG: EthD domain-containing protein [Myxococcota bacterium]
MIKLICFIKKKPELSIALFRDHWLNHHGPLIESLPDFRRHIVRYEQNCRLDADYERDQGVGFDGVTVQWFESRRDFYSFAMEPSYKDTIYLDEEKFLDRSAISFLLTEEPDVVIDGAEKRPSAEVKLIAMLERKTDIDRDAFRKHWATGHASIFRDTPELARHIIGYDQHRRLDADYDRDGGRGFDGVTEQWYESYHAFMKYIAEPAFASTVFPDERKFLVPEHTQWIVTRRPDVIISA